MPLIPLITLHNKSNDSAPQWEEKARRFQPIANSHKPRGEDNKSRPPLSNTAHYLYASVLLSTPSWLPCTAQLLLCHVFCLVILNNKPHIQYSFRADCVIIKISHKSLHVSLEPIELVFEAQLIFQKLNVRRVTLNRKHIQQSVPETHGALKTSYMKSHECAKKGTLFLYKAPWRESQLC